MCYRIHKIMYWNSVKNGLPDNDRIVKVCGDGWRAEGFARYRDGHWIWENEGREYDGKPITGRPVTEWAEVNIPTLP